MSFLTGLHSTVLATVAANVSLSIHILFVMAGSPAPEGTCVGCQAGLRSLGLVSPLYSYTEYNLERPEVPLVPVILNVQ